VTRAQFRYDPENVTFVVGTDETLPISRDDAIVAPVALVAEVPVAAFEQALKDYERHDAATVPMVFLSAVPIERFDPDLSERDVSLAFVADHLTVEVGRVLDESSASIDVPQLLAPLLDRHEAVAEGVYRDDQGGHEFEIHSLVFRDTSRSTGDMYILAVEAQALLDASVNTNGLTARSARDLVASGHADALRGQPEANWIDAKSEPHRTSTSAETFELAKDVAAFANTGKDAIIVWGFTAPEGPGGDVLDAPRPFKLGSVDLKAVRNKLRDHLIPILTDLEVDVVEVKAGYGYGWIFIPAQPEYVRPVMVRGVMAGNKFLGHHISVPVRVGEDTDHWDASLLHSLVQAGRVALQTATPPKPTPSDDAS
jgi:hypothetical protein